jgi:dolichyl-phosphate beta-glucosyltransferase
VITELPVVWRDMPGTTFSVRRHSPGCLLDVMRIRRAARRPADQSRRAILPENPSLPRLRPSSVSGDECQA